MKSVPQAGVLAVVNSHVMGQFVTRRQLAVHSLNSPAKAPIAAYFFLALRNNCG